MGPGLAPGRRRSSRRLTNIPSACMQVFRLLRSAPGSDRQARLEQASLVALTIDFALVMLGREVDGDREFRLTLQDLCRVRGGRDRVAHLRERGGEEGMMGVVRPCDPRKGL